jgi:hypothetical protein
MEFGQPADPTEDRFIELSDYLEHEAEWAPDNVMRAFHAKLGDRLFESSDHAIKILNFRLMDHYPDMLLVNLANLNMRNGQHYYLQHDPEYPSEKHEEPEGWDEFFDALESDETVQATWWKNAERNVQSNIPARYYLPKLILLLAGYDSVTLGDVGCSRNHGLKLQAIEDGQAIRYPLPKVMRRLEEGGLERDARGEKAVAGLVHKTRLGIRNSVGFDRVDMAEPDALEWARSCAFYPGELKEPGRVRQFDMLEEADPPEVHFHQTDFSEFDEGRYWQAFPDQPKFDAMFLSAVLYQMSADKAAAVLDNAVRHTKEDGWLFVADHLDLDENENFLFHERWEKWGFNLFGLNMAEPDKGFQKLISVESGRARKIILEPAIGELALAKAAGLA